MNRRANITQAELTRIFKAARDAGVSVARYEVKRDGSIVVHTSVAPASAADAADEWLRSQDAR